MTEVDGQLELPLELTDEQRAAVEQIAKRDEMRQAVQAKLAELQAGNNDTYNNLIAQGVQPDNVGVVMLRLNTLLDMILDTDNRAQFELRYEEQLNNALAQATAQVAASQESEVDEK